MQIANRDSAEHYIWGDGCDGWHMVKSAELSVIEERMPAGTSEARHRHERARQFFRVLEGELTIELEGEMFALRAGDGLEIAPGLAHQVMNRSESDVRMIVVSQPHSHGDRFPAPLPEAGIYLPV